MILRKKHRWFVTFFIIIGIALLVVAQMAGSKKHDFKGKCQLCHVDTPDADTPRENIVLTNKIEVLCTECHVLMEKTSHPIGMVPKSPIPLERYLEDGKLTCTTCHDVHKEDKEAFRGEDVKDLLHGHIRGRAFCATCHDAELLGANWRHDMAITYAHSKGKLTQEESGTFLDKASVECLSCHDGVISKSGSTANVRSGSFTHGIGLTHPIGVEYPRYSLKNDFEPITSLSEEMQLPGGRLSCLSCHNLYGGRKYFLIMDNRRSALCVNCHRK